MSEQTIQLVVFCIVLGAIALITYIKCSGQNRHSADSNKEYFLAGGGLTWIFVAGSITLTNLSTDQLVGMNGNQMMLLAIWELAGFVGLMVLAKVFLPVYYRNNCTTTTELLEKRYDSKHIRALVSTMFLFINIFVIEVLIQTYISIDKSSKSKNILQYLRSLRKSIIFALNNSKKCTWSLTLL